MANFIKVPDEIMLSKKLSHNEKILMSVLLYYDRQVKWGKYKDIHPNQMTLAEQCNMSIKSVNRTVKSLKEKRYIKTIQKVNRSSLVYELNTKKVRTESLSDTSQSPSDRSESPKGYVTESQRLGLKVPLDNTRKDYKILDKEKNKKKSVRRPDIPYDEIVNYLNSKLGKSNGKGFKSYSDKSVSAINARFGEGHTLSDFKAVITDRYRKWHDDPKMSEYLRPSTLFGTKFEEYLVAANKTIKQERPIGRRII